MYIHTCTFIHNIVVICTYYYIHIYTYTYKYTYIHTYKYTYMYIHTYKYTHTVIYTPAKQFELNTYKFQPQRNYYIKVYYSRNNNGII